MDISNNEFFILGKKGTARCNIAIRPHMQTVEGVGAVSVLDDKIINLRDCTSIAKLIHEAKINILLKIYIIDKTLPFFHKPFTFVPIQVLYAKTQPYYR